MSVRKIEWTIDGAIDHLRRFAVEPEDEDAVDCVEAEVLRLRDETKEMVPTAIYVNALKAMASLQARLARVEELTEILMVQAKDIIAANGHDLSFVDGWRSASNTCIAAIAMALKDEP